MSWILPREILMSTDLTWQAVLFIAIGALNGVALLAWATSKAVRAWRDALA